MIPQICARTRICLCILSLTLPAQGAAIILNAVAAVSQSSFSRTVGYNSPFVPASGVGFQLSDITVTCNNGCLSYSLTNEGLTDAAGNATTGSISTQAAATSNHGGTIVNANANAYAGASLDSATVRVAASGNFLDSYPNPNSGQDGGSGRTFAQFNDVLHFNVSGASANTPTLIEITYTVQGSITGSSGSADIVNIFQFGNASFRDEALAVLPTQLPRISSVNAGNWVSYDFPSQTPGLTIFHGVYSLTGPQTDVPIAATLTADCGTGANCDYTHAAQFAVTVLPANVTYTSDSGVFLTKAAAPVTPTITSVVNGGDLSPRLAPGALAVVYGTNFGTGPVASVTATVGGKTALINSVTANQISLQVPSDAPVGATSLSLTAAGLTAAPYAISLDTYAPALLTSNGSGTGSALLRTQSGANVTSASPARAGDAVLAFATGLGTSDPTALVKLTLGGQAVVVSSVVAAAGMPGVYQIGLTVPSGLQGNQVLVLAEMGRNSSPVTVPLFGISAVVSNASFGSAGIVSPGSIVSVFANGLGTVDQNSGFPATAFQGVSVTFNGTPAPIFHLTASQSQVDLLVPYELPNAGSVSVQLKTPLATSAGFPTTAAPASPALYFVVDPSTPTRRNVLAQFNNTAWLAMPDTLAAALKIPGNCAASNLNSASLCGEPAKAGDYLVLYVTGLGKATPKGDPNGVQLKTGDIPPTDGSVLYQTVALPSVSIGGAPALVVFSGIAPGFPGLYQIDFQVPNGVTGDDVPVLVSIAGTPAETRTMAIRPK
jgi:uncharacterized protein (TIGR03437 family)